MAKTIEELTPIAVGTEKAINKLAEVGMHMGAAAMSPKLMTAFAFAAPFMDVAGDVVLAWMLLWRAAVASTKLSEKVKNSDQTFYNGQLQSARFFIETVLPVTQGRMRAILGSCDAAIAIDEDAFGGK